VIRKIFAVCILLFAAADPAPSADARAEIPVGGTLREAKLQGLNGPSRKLSAYLGKPLIINVWASWCAPCREEMQSLERLAWSGHRQEFAIIGISTDDYPEKALSLLDVTHATISQFIDTGQQVEDMLGASRLPLTVLVGPEGRVLQKVYGARAWDGPDALRLIAQTFGDGR
jgi:thiol-disulfide isomerase/thioredoxin